jgi:Protein of unknown function (DUF2829)
MKKYYGTKDVMAEPKASPSGAPGYAVVYEDGYESWSPAYAFEKAYQPTDALSFGHAIVALKQGNRVARRGWNGKNMFLYYVPASTYPANRNTYGTMLGVFPDNMVPYGAYIAMKTAQDNVVPWLASQTDVLADDWCIIG